MSDNDLADLADAMPGIPVAPAHGIAAIALQMAMKYHDMGMVKDGQLYQQYKVEGRDIQEIELADVFDTAIQIEAHLLGSEQRIAEMIVDALSIAIDEDDAPQAAASEVRDE
jgi:hypothetical protein